MKLDAISIKRNALTANKSRGGATSLGLARVLYLGLVGLGFLWAAQVGDPGEIGTYSLAVAATAILTVISQAGLDRLLLVEISKNPDLGLSDWATWWRRRQYAVYAVVSLAAIAAFVNLLAIPAAFLVLSRLLLNDFENIALGQTRTKMVAISTVSNGLVSAVAIALAGRGSASTLLWASSSGNIVALLLIAIVILKTKRYQGQPSEPLSLEWKQALPFAGMAIAAAIYQRADLTLMGILGLGVAQLAAYAIALRAFEALIAFRGAIVQHEATYWAIENIEHMRVYKWSIKICSTSSAVGILVIVVSLLAPRTGLLSQYDNLWILVGLIGVGAPLIGSHTVTSTWIYSKPGSYRTMRLSVGLSVMSIVLTVGAIFFAGIWGVAAVASIKEYVSYLVFKRVLPRAHRTTQCLTEIAMWPFATLALSAFYYIGYWVFNG